MKTLKIAALAATLLLAAPIAYAQAVPPAGESAAGGPKAYTLSVSQLRLLLNGLTDINAPHSKESKDEAVNKVVAAPYKFSDGTSAALSTDQAAVMQALIPIERGAQQTAAAAGPKAVQEDGRTPNLQTPEGRELAKKLEALADQKWRLDLFPLKINDLKPSDNGIAPQTLMMLLPITDTGTAALLPAVRADASDRPADKK